MDRPLHIFRGPVRRAAALTALSAVLLLAGCGYDRFSGYGPLEQHAPAANVELAALRARWHGTPLGIDQDMVVTGVVTSDDAAGNFHRTLVIQDATGALEFKTGLYDMHNSYPRGRRVTLSLRGLVMDLQAGVLQIGAPAPSWSHYATDYLGHRAIVERYLHRGAMQGSPQPVVCTAGGLSAGLCGMLVRVNGMRLTGEGPSVGMPPAGSPVSRAAPSATAAIPPSAGYRRFSDEGGAELLVFTSGYAAFAGEQIPPGNLSLTGILLYGPAPGSGGRSMFCLRLRDPGDVIRE